MNKMNCENIADLIPLLALDELAPEQKQQLESHITQCKTCAEQLAAIRATLSLLNEAVAVEQEPKLSDERRNNLIKAVAVDSKKTKKKSLILSPPRTKIRPFVGIAASIAILLILGALMLPALGRAGGGRRRSVMSKLGRIISPATKEAIPFETPASAVQSDFEAGDDAGDAVPGGMLETSSGPVAFAPRHISSTTRRYRYEANNKPSDKLVTAKRENLDYALRMNGQKKSGDADEGKMFFDVEEKLGERAAETSGGDAVADMPATSREFAFVAKDRAQKDRREYVAREAKPPKRKPKLRNLFPFGKSRWPIVTPDRGTTITRMLEEKSKVAAPIEHSQTTGYAFNCEPGPTGSQSYYWGAGTAAKEQKKLAVAAEKQNEVTELYVRLDPAKDEKNASEELDVNGGGNVAIHIDVPTVILYDAATQPDSETLPKSPTFKAEPVNPWVMSAKDRLSTFAVDVDTASYAIARSYIRKGYLPPVASVRMEEFVNAFDYNYPRQGTGAFSINTSAAPSPFGRGSVLLKIGVQERVAGRERSKPAHLVFVVDSSGSMARPDRIALVQFALTKLVGELNATDRISLVTYGTRARLALEAVQVADKKQVLKAIDNINCSGSTNMGEAMVLGYQMAARAFITGGINRVILCSDGIANVGSDKADAMLANVKKFRDQGITFTGVGFGSAGYNDVLMENLANRGDGNYVYVDSEAEAQRVFVDDMAATLQTMAKDAKIQVDFDPSRVRRYRLIGFENRKIADKDFRNDTVDAGEVGSGQSSTALYELELFPTERVAGAVQDIGTVYVRYQNVETGKVEELSHRIAQSVIKKRIPAKAPRFYLAACAAEFAEILRQSEHANDGDIDNVRHTLEQVAIALPLDARVQELLQLVRSAKGLPRAK